MENLILTQQNIYNEMESLRKKNEKKLNDMIHEFFGNDYNVYSLGTSQFTFGFVYDVKNGYEYRESLSVEFHRGCYYDDNEGEFRMATNVAAMGSFDINNPSTRQFKYYNAVGMLMTNAELKSQLENLLTEYFDEMSALQDKLYPISRQIEKIEQAKKQAEVDKQYEDEFNETMENIKNNTIEDAYVLMDKNWDKYCFFTYRKKAVHLHSTKVFGYYDAYRELNNLPRHIRESVKVVELKKIKVNR